MEEHFKTALFKQSSIRMGEFSLRVQRVLWVDASTWELDCVWLWYKRDVHSHDSASGIKRDHSQRGERIVLSEAHIVIKYKWSGIGTIMQRLVCFTDKWSLLFFKKVHNVKSDQDHWGQSHNPLLFQLRHYWRQQHTSLSKFSTLPLAVKMQKWKERTSNLLNLVNELKELLLDSNHLELCIQGIFCHHRL